MIKKSEITKNGHTFISLTLSDMIKINGMGICDSCATIMKNGKMIPVLNSVYCDECFETWSKQAKYYEEDKKYEKSKTNQILEVLNDFK